jgi:hypothetical protein
MTSAGQLDALIDELTVDAYGDDEQLAGAELAPRKRSNAASRRGSPSPSSRS